MVHDLALHYGRCPSFEIVAVRLPIFACSGSFCLGVPAIERWLRVRRCSTVRCRSTSTRPRRTTTPDRRALRRHHLRPRYHANPPDRERPKNHGRPPRRLWSGDLAARTGRLTTQTWHHVVQRFLAKFALDCLAEHLSPGVGGRKLQRLPARLRQGCRGRAK
jgi:hypothetical protein